MIFIPFKRATLLMPSGPDHDVERKHLFILMTDPVENLETKTKEVLVVSLSTIKPNSPYDDTCIIRPYEHPFIKHDSFVFYRNSAIKDCDKLINGVKQGIFKAKGIIDMPVFSRICSGIETSRFIPSKCLKFYQRFLLS
jgi:5'(3')-deoxyribonucleotidase